MAGHLVDDREAALVCRHRDQHAAPRSKQAEGLVEQPAVVLDVLEHLEGQDGAEPRPGRVEGVEGGPQQLLAGCLLEILCEPLRAFLLEIAQQAGSAIGKRLAQRLRRSRRSKRRSNRR